MKIAQAIDDSEFIKTLFPTAYKSMYKEPQSKIEEDPEQEHLDLWGQNTPLKINMEPQNEGLEDANPLQLGDLQGF